VLKLHGAAVLCEEPCTIANARIADIEYIPEVPRDLGAEACWIGEHGCHSARGLDFIRSKRPSGSALHS
jgi:hypothetical protein